MENIKSEEDVKRYFAKFFDSEQVRENLTLAGLYLSAFEVLKKIIIGNIRSFYVFDFPQNGEWDAEKIRSKEYVAAITKFYPKSDAGKFITDEYVACAKWFEDSKAITSEEVETIIKIRKERNKIAHELPNLLLDPEMSIDFPLITEMVRLINKIDRWWVVEVELATDPPELHEGKEIDYDGILSGRMIYMNHVIRMVFEKEFQALEKAEGHKV